MEAFLSKQIWHNCDPTNIEVGSSGRGSERARAFRWLLEGEHDEDSAEEEDDDDDTDEDEESSASPSSVST